MTNYYNSPRWSAELPYCPDPFTFDQYSNCSHGCIYCFSQYQRMMIKGKGRQDYIENKAKPVNIKAVKDLFSPSKKSQYSTYIKARKIMQWGGLSDPFCAFEKRSGVGLELLRFFRKIDYPLSFSTKGTWWLDDSRYTELFKNNKNWHVRMSIITLNKKIASKIEPRVPSPQNRLKAIKKLAKLDIGSVNLRLRPFIFGISDLDYLDLINASINAGISSLSIGFFCHDYRMTKNNQNNLNKISGFDQISLYKKFSANKGCPMRLNRNIKRKYVNNVENLCHDKGIKFAVGDRHFKERGDLYKHNYYCKGQFAYASILCKLNGTVKWSEITPDMTLFKNVKYQLFNEPCERRSRFLDFTIYDYLHYLWNNPSESQSPYRIFEGIMAPFDKDSSGDLIYKYNQDKG